MTSRTAGHRGVRADAVRAVVVLVAAVAQTAAGALGGSGAFGESQKVLADRYPSPLMPATVAFSVWSLIYLALLALAVRQVLPGQRPRPVNRATGWWFAASAVLNGAWIVIFSQEQLILAQLVIVALLACLVVLLVRLARFPAQGTADRLLLHGPLAFYSGWVALATAVGAATTLTYVGAGPGPVTGAFLLLVAVLAVAAGTRRTVAALPFAATALWALLWITTRAPTPVAVVAVLGGAAVLTSAVLRSRDGIRAAFG